MRDADLGQLFDRLTTGKAAVAPGFALYLTHCDLHGRGYGLSALECEVRDTGY